MRRMCGSDQPGSRGEAGGQVPPANYSQVLGAVGRESPIRRSDPLEVGSRGSRSIAGALRRGEGRGCGAQWGAEPGATATEQDVAPRSSPQAAALAPPQSPYLQCTSRSPGVSLLPERGRRPEPQIVEGLPGQRPQNGGHCSSHRSSLSPSRTPPNQAGQQHQCKLTPALHQQFLPDTCGSMTGHPCSGARQVKAHKMAGAAARVRALTARRWWRRKHLCRRVPRSSNSRLTFPLVSRPPVRAPRG